jgi:hypothetical protein
MSRSAAQALDTAADASRALAVCVRMEGDAK